MEDLKYKSNVSTERVLMRFGHCEQSNSSNSVPGSSGQVAVVLGVGSFHFTKFPFHLAEFAR